MPGCFQGTACPKYDFAAVYGAPPPEDGKDAPKTPEELAKEKAFNDLNKLKVTLPPESHVTKCQMYCQAVQQAEAEKCRKLRLKVALALENAGCPSNVTPRTTAMGGTLPCQQGGMLPFHHIGVSSNSCANGMCGVGIKKEE